MGDFLFREVVLEVDDRSHRRCVVEPEQQKRHAAVPRPVAPFAVRNREKGRGDLRVPKTSAEADTRAISTTAVREVQATGVDAQLTPHPALKFWQTRGGRD